MPTTIQRYPFLSTPAGYKNCSSCNSHVTITAAPLSPLYPASRIGRLPLSGIAGKEGKRGRERERGRGALKGSRFLWVGLPCLLPGLAWLGLAWSGLAHTLECKSKGMSTARRRTSQRGESAEVRGWQAGDKSIL